MPGARGLASMEDMDRPSPDVSGRPPRSRLEVGILALSPFLVLAALVWDGSRTLLPYHHQVIIEREARSQGVDPLLVAAVIRVESGFEEDATSPAGARGLMQLMPQTARWLAWRAGDPDPTARLDEPEVNIHLGVSYLRYLDKQFAGDLPRVLAAYNAGQGSAARWSNLEEAYPETRSYVRRVLWARKAYGWRYDWRFGAGS